MVRYRYTAWDGTQRTELDADELFARLAEHLGRTDDLDAALDALLAEGFDGDGFEIVGIDELLARVERALDELYSTYNLDHALDDPVRCLDELLETEEAAARDAGDGERAERLADLLQRARRDLLDELHHQVADSIGQGAVPVTGCEPLPGPGAFYRPSILDGVSAGMRAYAEELFGPVASVIRARDESDAVRLANDNRYGLGASVWTRDSERGERVARRLQAGAVFVNGMVMSDPRLPFGGIKASGYGRELSHHGIREFLNAKTLWIK